MSNLEFQPTMISKELKFIPPKFSKKEFIPSKFSKKRIYTQ